MGTPLPQDVHDRAELLCRSHDQKTVAGLLGVCEDVIGAMRRRGWKAVPPGRHRRPRPSDFAIQVRHMKQQELRAHYRTGCDNITRWRRELAQ